MHGAEMIAYNAQPAAMTSEMWVQNYLSTINEVAAVDFHPHAWITPGSRLDHAWITPGSRTATTRRRMASNQTSSAVQPTSIKAGRSGCSP